MLFSFFSVLRRSSSDVLFEPNRKGLHRVEIHLVGYIAKRQGAVVYNKLLCALCTQTGYKFMRRSTEVLGKRTNKVILTQICKLGKFRNSYVAVYVVKDIALNIVERNNVFVSQFRFGSGITALHGLPTFPSSMRT